jgi:hypothetical protein
MTAALPQPAKTQLAVGSSRGSQDALTSSGLVARAAASLAA